MHLLAPAKINLHLRVGPRRADGFHPLLSWMTTAGLFDTLELEEQTPRSANAAPVLLECDRPELPCDERNLIVRVALAWKQSLQSAMPVRVRLVKQIPIGAGLGGGSSDGARALLGLNRLWKRGWAADDLSAFAARFGSDLPFFFHGPSSVCRGRGEIVTPVPTPTPRWAVLILPNLAMPTAKVYQRFDELGLGCERDIDEAPDWGRWGKLESEELLANLVNDLEAPASSLAPELSALRERIEELIGRIVRMSGSGSSLFTLFDRRPAAQQAAEHIERDTQERARVVEVAPVFRDDLNDEIR